MSTGRSTTTYARDPWFRNTAIWVPLLWLFFFPVLLMYGSVSGADVFGLSIMAGFCLPFLLGGGTVWLFCPSGHARISRRLRLVLLLLSLALLLSIPVTLWPLRTVFPWYQGQLERLAERVQHGYVMTQPQRIGLLTVYKAHIIDSRGVILWTDDGCNGGLMQAPNGPGGFLSTGSCGYISDVWWLVAED